MTLKSFIYLVFSLNLSCLAILYVARNEKIQIQASSITSASKELQVYICKGPDSKRYHYTKECRGLKNCSTKIYEVTLSEAKKLERTLCRWEK